MDQIIRFIIRRGGFERNAAVNIRHTADILYFRNSGVVNLQVIGGKVC